MINGQKEIWISTNPRKKDARIAIAISNCGRLMRGDGTIEFTMLRQPVSFNGKRRYIYRILADIFIPKTEEDIIRNRDIIDHITHHPTDMNVNDVRNLRWCTYVENARFPEAHKNKSDAQKGYTNHKGKTHSEETKAKMSNARKSFIAKSIEEHYGKQISDIRRLYETERCYYRRHKKFRWEY